MKKEKEGTVEGPFDILQTLFAFKGFAICFFRMSRFFGAVVSNEDGLSVAFVFFSPVSTGVNCTQYVFCHEGSPPLIVVGIINQLAIE
jgi:hypothetical protein